jgi:hypothetical protein
MVWPTSAGLTQSIRPLALMTLIKNPRRHSLPPLKRISSRDSPTSLEWSLPTWQGLQREKGIITYTSRHREFRYDKRYMVHPSLPQHRSRGSGRWMCTWKTKSRQISPAMQRYIPTNVQWSVSNTSKMGSQLTARTWVLLLTYSRASSQRRQRRRRNNLLGGDQRGQER